MGVIIAFMSAGGGSSRALAAVNAEHAVTNAMGGEGYKWLGVAFFALMGLVLYRFAISRKKTSI
jgi:hypothetical protein